MVGFESSVSPEELAGLACEEDVHCRLVIEEDGANPWQLRYGPFEDTDFLELPETHYSLLVSECEKWLPELGELLDQFDFIPDWRIDDLMLSYAMPRSMVRSDRMSMNTTYSCCRRWVRAAGNTRSRGSRTRN